MKKIFLICFLLAFVCCLSLVNSGVFAQSPAVGLIAFIILIYATVFFHEVATTQKH